MPQTISCFAEIVTTIRLSISISCLYTLLKDFFRKMVYAKNEKKSIEEIIFISTLYTSAILEIVTLLTN